MLKPQAFVLRPDHFFRIENEKKEIAEERVRREKSKKERFEKEKQRKAKEMERRAAQLKEIQGTWLLEISLVVLTQAFRLNSQLDFLKSCRHGEKKRKRMITMN